MMQELSLNVLDVAQNSVRAEACCITISVDICSDKDTLTISIEDDGCGMTSEQVAQVTDPFFTTRTTRKVGLGVSFLKMAAELSGGTFSITSQKNIGTVVTAVFGLSHIDRMPLGDMADTMCALIQCNPHIRFIYRFACDGRSFAADTEEFSAVLEGVPLNEPQVLTFIRNDIHENTLEALNGITV